MTTINDPKLRKLYDSITGGRPAPKKATVKRPKGMPKIDLERKRLNRQGYTSSGQYYGTGAALFLAFNPDTGEYLEFRARDRSAAQEILKKIFTNTRDPSVQDKFNGHWELEKFVGEAWLQTRLESKPGKSGNWRRVYYQNAPWYVFEQRGSKLLLSKRPNDTLWVHKVDPSEVVEEP
jgi:hypothetical protein